MRRCGNSRRKGHDVEAKEFGRFIAGMRKEKKMTQAELAEKIHVTDKAVSRWERGLGFPDIQTIEPLAQALGISVLELMRSERQEKAKEEAAPEIQYTQKEVAEMLQNAGDISRQQKKQDRNANVIAGFLVIGVAAAAWAAKIVNVGGGLILGGLVAAAFVSLWYFFQQIFKILIWFQVVCLCCFCNTVDHSEGLCPVYSINDLPVLLFMCLRT